MFCDFYLTKDGFFAKIRGQIGFRRLMPNVGLSPNYSDSTGKGAPYNAKRS